MTKTGKQIQGDLYRLLRASRLAEVISGGVYRAGQRPKDSPLEDAVVIFTGGLPHQIQTGVVTIHLYVPDRERDDGVLVEDGGRAEELERLAGRWVESLTAAVSCYKFKLQQTIYTEEEAEINQHFIVVKLAYEFMGADDAPPDIEKMRENEKRLWNLKN